MVPGAKYKLVFNGEVAGHDLTVVKKNLSVLLRIDSDTTERLFQGKPVVVKKDLDSDTAIKYQLAFERTGAVCRIVPMVVPPEGFGPEVSQTTVPDAARNGKPPSALPAPQSKKMRCPRCSIEQQEAELCNSCGMVVKKDVKQFFVIPKDHDMKAGGGAGGSIGRRAVFLGLLVLTLLVAAATGRLNGLIPGAQGDIKKLLADEAAKDSVGLPKNIDDDTRLDSVAVGADERVTYNFTLRKLSANNLDVENFRLVTKAKLKRQVCKDKVKGPLLKQGAMMTFSYDGYDGTPVAQISFVQATCQ